MAINLLPIGHLSFTWIKECDGEDGFGFDDVALFGGVRPGSSSLPDEVGSAKESIANALRNRDPTDPREWAEASNNFREGLNEASHLDSHDFSPVYHIDQVDDYKPPTIPPPSTQTVVVASHLFNLKNPDVFTKGMPTPKYQTSGKAALDLSKTAVIKADQDVIFFFVSSVASSQTLGKPFVDLDERHKKYLQPSIEGIDSFITVGANKQPAVLKLSFNCIKGGGVFPVPISIPINAAYGTATVSWRVVKICGGFEVKEQFYWTAPRVLTVIAIFAGLIALLVGLHFVRKAVAAKKSVSNAMYAPVNTSA